MAGVAARHPRARRANLGPTRALFVFSPNGKNMPDWTPEKTGDAFALPHLLEPLAAHQKRLLVLSGLALDAALEHGDGPGDHARGAATFLTCAHPFKTGGANIRAGISVDQVIAAKIGSETRFPSLELGCRTAGSGRLRLGLQLRVPTNIVVADAAGALDARRVLRPRSGDCSRA